MTIETFITSLSNQQPPAQLSPALMALWLDGNGDWPRAHELINDLSDEDSAWVHAYLHRKEGDAGNAAYWYRRAGKPVYSGSLDEEWKSIAQALLER